MRALSIVEAYLSEREAFGSPLSEKQRARYDVAEAWTRLNAARALVRTAAEEIAAGNEARIEVSMSKVFTAGVVQDVIDTAVQYCGGNGIARDLPLADFYEQVRPFRLVDGADEVHLRTIARAAFEDIDESELDSVVRFGE